MTPPAPGCGDTVWCLWYSQRDIPKSDGSQSWLAIQMRVKGGQIPLFHFVFCPDNHVPQKWSRAVLGTGTDKVATSPCLEQFTEEGIKTVGELELGNDSKEQVYVSHSFLLLEGEWRGQERQRGSVEGMGPAVAEPHVLGQQLCGV